MAYASLRTALNERYGPALHEQLALLLAGSPPGPERTALESVLRRHVPSCGDWGVSCSCWASHGTHPLWPCEEVTDILMALTGQAL